MPLIELTKGKTAIVDKEDYEELSKNKWCLSHYGYAVRRKPGGGILWMHRELLKSGIKDVDHINGDKLDNRKSNLRAATKYENSLNKPVRKDSKLGIKGVRFQSRSKTLGVFQARIAGKHIGIYPTMKAAALAYDEAAAFKYGRFAKLNGDTI